MLQKELMEILESEAMPQREKLERYIDICVQGGIPPAWNEQAEEMPGWEAVCRETGRHD